MTRCQKSHDKRAKIFWQHGRFRPMILALSSIAFSCGDNRLPLQVVLQTEHFDVYRQFGLPPACEEAGIELESYYEAFQKYVGASPGRLAYRQYAIERDAWNACGGAAPNCYLRQSKTIVSTEPFYPHEIAHAFEGAIGGTAPAPLFFAEGFAAALGGGFTYSTADRRVDTSPLLEELIDSDRFREKLLATPGALYDSVAGFVHFLIDSAGRESFLAFYAAVKGLTRQIDIEPHFRRAFGTTIKMAVEAWRNGPQPIVDDLLLVIPGCDDLPPAAVDQPEDIDPGCGARRFAFDVPASGRVDLSVVAASGRSTVQLWGCGLGNVIPFAALSMAGANSAYHVAVDVPPGKYIGAVRDGPARVTVRGLPVSVDANGQCTADRIPVVLDAQESFVYTRRWVPVEASVGLDFRTVDGGRLDISALSNRAVNDNTGPLDYYLCSSACPAVSQQNCAHDNLFELQTQVDIIRDVFDVDLAPGDLRHFETGPRYFHDWAYSVQLSLRP